MLHRKLPLYVATLTVAAGLLASGGTAALAQATGGSTADTKSPLVTTATITGITAPSQRVKLASPVPGIVLERSVKAGDAVKKGDPLIKLDDRIEQGTLKSAEAEANAAFRVDAATADLALKKVQLERKEKLYKERVASVSEVEEARVTVVIGEISIKLAQHEQMLKAIERDRQALKIDLMTLRSPIDGQVESVDVGDGEWADPQKPQGAVTVVKNDPLWVEIHLPTRQSQHLDRNVPLMVKGQDDERPVEAKIIYVNPVADAASDTQLVRLEMPNPQNRSSGLQVTVTLPDKVAALAEGR